MAAAHWKGYLDLSLVTAPIALYPASSRAEKTHFHQINRRTSNRLRQQMVDEKTGEVVNKDDKSRAMRFPRANMSRSSPRRSRPSSTVHSHTRYGKIRARR
jgi:non-homologous end joining protein Ku